MLSLIEKYITLSGEAPVPGRPVYLIRLSGCNLRCDFCDTPYREERNLSLSAADLIGDITARTERYPQLDMLITGGEPLRNEHKEQLVEIITAMPGLRFYIETNGTLALPDKELPNCRYVVDWKAPSAGTKLPFLRENLQRLHPDRDCIKIVLCPEDLRWAKQTIGAVRQVQPRLPVYLSPVWGRLSPADLAAFILENRLDAFLSVQLHKYIWPEKQRGV
jgi:7-carboxy-7-deazaguanine synthase